MKRFADVSKIVAGATLIFLAIGWVYHASLHNDLLADDLWAIEHNTSIRQLFPLWENGAQGSPLRPQLGTPFSARPLVNLTFAVNYHFSELNVWSYRITQIAMHVLATLILWVVVFETLRLPFFCDRYRGTAKSLAFACAAIWGLHPLTTETIAYLTQRTELMMGLFMLVSLWSCIRYWRAESTKSSCCWFALAWINCLLGVLCKETMATLPAVVACYWWVFIRPQGAASDKNSGLFKILPLLGALSSCWIVIACIYGAGYVTPGGGFDNDIGAVDWWYTQSQAVFLYLKLSFWPAPLTIHYNFSIHHQLSQCWPWVFGCGLLMLATCHLLYRRYSMGFVLAVFFIVLSPTLVVPLPGETIAERRMYVPLAAIAPFVVVVVTQCTLGLFTTIWPSRQRKGSATALTAVLVTGLAIGLAMLSHTRTLDYCTRITIWRDAMDKQSHSKVATMNYGIVLAAAGQLDDGITYLEKAVQIDPEDQRARFNLGYAYEAAYRFRDAENQYREAVQVDGDSATHYNLARLLEDRGAFEEAIQHYRDACRLVPRFTDAHINLGLLLYDPYLTEQADKQDAIDHFTSAWTHLPSIRHGLILASAHLETQNLSDAMKVALQIQEIQQDDLETQARIESLIRQIRAAASQE